MKQKLQLGVLSGGISGERYLSLRSGEYILRSLSKETDLEISFIDWQAQRKWVLCNRLREELQITSSLQSILDHNKFDCIFNAFNGAQEVDGHIASILDLSGIPYVGNSFFTSFIGMDKIISKMLCNKYNLPVLQDHIIHCRTEPIPDRLFESFDYPYIIKPALSGSSIGVELVKSREILLDYIETAKASFFPLIIEPFIRGREYCVTQIGPLKDEGLICPPIVEMKYPGEYFDQECKQKGNYNVTIADLPFTIQKKMMEFSEKFHSIIKASVMSRTDLLLDDNGECWIIEINTHPGLGECSIVPSQLREMGLDFSDVLIKLIDNALCKEI